MINDLQSLLTKSQAIEKKKIGVWIISGIFIILAMLGMSGDTTIEKVLGYALFGSGIFIVTIHELLVKHISDLSVTMKQSTVMFEQNNGADA